MAPSRIRKALGAVKDQTSIGLAKVGSSNAISDLDVAIVKATRHDEQPAEEKYIREILSLTCYSRMYISSCVSSISKRLTKTRSWAVALKSLVLLHRLLIEGDPAYEQEIFFATRRGTRLLNLSDFRDTSRTDSWDFSAFVRTFALYLDEHLEFRMLGRRVRRTRSIGGDDDDVEATPSSVRSTPVREMKTERIFNRTQHLQLLLERFIACRPTGAAKNSRIVAIALYPMVKESYQIYFDLIEIMGILIDRFMELEVADCVKVHEIFSRISKQFEELDKCYKWCKTVGIARSSEYPDVEKITPKKLEVMEEFIRDKSALASRKLKQVDDAAVETKPAEETEYDINSIKALPAPESAGEVVVELVEVVVGGEEVTKPEKPEEEPADFLNLGAEAVKPEEHGDQLALALFDGGATDAAAPPKWEAFTSEENADWETALVQSASSLSTQKAALGGGFDQLLLDAMYQHQPPAGNALGFTGSASSMAVPQGQPLLALPAPLAPTGALAGGDPFAASLVVEPPAYVRISDMEKKQHLLVEEQIMWQQYAKEGMRGQLELARLQQNPYPMGGHQQRF
ncbi:unnamed protein product [Spirodela intermedia]|uniref:ENTH domain-containing protein n=1 Tax=Spirodela intermedia TaxID=51605 RepID=A0A7I8IRD8_SPIIN|nr:unnamed protein product [Spirodela intermedia]CAA6660363.1 unnamed protein product [Spirodela intermedia]